MSGTRNKRTRAEQGELDYNTDTNTNNNEELFLIGAVLTVTVAQSAANWRNTHTLVDRTHSLTHLHQHSYSHFVRSASAAITEFGIDFLYFFEGRLPEGGGRKPGVAGENPR